MSGISLLETAVRERELSLSGSYVVGDKKADADLARALGIPSIHLKTGHGRDERERYGPRLGATHQAPHLLSAANWILRSSIR
ncbi:MAG: HAD hydrolase-like protein [Elusimicrobia bacterium]|nr:HAD hydrolase-like protein [Elusimicrobiota bacterium]